MCGRRGDNDPVIYKDATGNSIVNYTMIPSSSHVLVNFDYFF